jgi:transposase
MEETIKPDDTVKPKRTYPQMWREYNLAQTYEKAHLQALLYELCQGIEAPEQVIGRPRLSLPDVVFATVFKAYVTFSGRRLMTDLREAQQRGYLTKAPHFNSIYGYLEMPFLTPYLQTLITQSSLPMKAIESDFAVDSSGFSTGRFERWFDVRYGEQDYRGWLKMHLICGVRTNIVVGVEMSGPHANDYPFFKPLVNRAKDIGFNLKEVSADKAYLGAENLRTTLLAGAIPYIPFKENSNPDNGGTVWKRLYHFYSYHNEEFKAHYHKRSNVESTFNMVKSKFGERLRSKTRTAQINEALTKVLCHNLCCLIHSIYELGIDPTFCEDLLPSQNLSR